MKNFALITTSRVVIFVWAGVLTIFLTLCCTEMAIFLTVDCNEASMCWNCEEICGKRKEVFLTLFLRNVWGFFQPQCEESMCWNSTGIFLTIFFTFGMWGKRTFTIVREKVLKFPYIFPNILLLSIFLTIFLTFTFPHIFLTFLLTFGMWGKRTFTTLMWGKCQENMWKMWGNCEEFSSLSSHFPHIEIS